MNMHLRIYLSMFFCLTEYVFLYFFTAYIYMGSGPKSLIRKSKYSCESRCRQYVLSLRSVAGPQLNTELLKLGARFALASCKRAFWFQHAREVAMKMMQKLWQTCCKYRGNSSFQVQNVAKSKENWTEQEIKKKLKRKKPKTSPEPLLS